MHCNAWSVQYTEALSHTYTLDWGLTNGVYVMTKWIKQCIYCESTSRISHAPQCLTNLPLCKWPKGIVLRHLFVLVKWLIFYNFFWLCEKRMYSCFQPYWQIMTVFRSTVNYELWLDLFYNWTCVQKKRSVHFVTNLHNCKFLFKKIKNL